MRLRLTGCLLFPFALLAQGLNYVHYNTNNSRLPHDIVYHIRQSTDGYLWISTDDGLIRYDGTEMTACNQGLRSHYVIATDESNGLSWISTWKGGIHLLENGHCFPVKTPNVDAFSLCTNGILASGDVVIAYNFADYMAFRVDRKHRMLLPISLKRTPTGLFWMRPGPEYYHFFKTASGLLACNDSGVYAVRKGKLQRLQTALIPDEIRQSHSGALYLRKGYTIYRSNAAMTVLSVFCTIHPNDFRPGKLTTFRVLPSGNICLGFSELRQAKPFDYYLLNRQTKRIFDLSRETGCKARIADLFVDAEGGIWLSTDGDGVYHVFDWKFRLLSSDNSFRGAGINALYSSGSDSLYIGTKKGIYLFHGQHIALAKGTERYYVLRLFGADGGRPGSMIDRIGDLFSIALSPSGQRRLTYYDRRIFPGRTVLIDNSPAAAISMESIPGSRNAVLLKMNELVIDLAEDGHKRLWIATPFRMYTYTPAKGIQSFRNRQLEHVRVNCLCFHPGKGLWIGTNNGLFLLEDNGTLHHWGEDQGLTNQNIRCLLSDRPNSLWIGTQNGLFHLDRNQLSIFKKRDGLIADDVSCLAVLNRKDMAVGSSKGVSLLPFATRQQATSATVTLAQLTVDGISRFPNQLLELPHSSGLYLRYRSTTFVYPELLQFRYRLNASENWIVTANTSLFFSHLKPGNYQLELSVRKYNSAFSPPLLIRFTILPPWWRSWLFIGSVTTAITGLALFLFRLQLKRQQRVLRSRQELSELRMKALQAQLNPHFVSNALSVIQYYVLKRDERAMNRYLGQFSELTRLFLEVSRRGLIPLSMELELLTHYLQLEQMRFEEKVDFTITVAPDIDCGHTLIPGLLIQPLVENSIHHGLVYLPKGRTGKVAIRIFRDGTFIHIAVDDNGIGRERSREIRRNSAHTFESRSGTILQELQDTYNARSGSVITITTTDKHTSSGEPSGTLVVIRLNVSLIHDSHASNR